MGVLLLYLPKLPPMVFHFLRRVFFAGLFLFVAGSARGIVLTPAALRTVLSVTNQAALVGLAGVDPLSCPLIPMTQTFEGGKLIFSDSPESPAARGMLYLDTNLAATVAGITNRIFVYHVNSNSTTRMKFSVLIKNEGASAGTLTVSQAGLAGPSTSYALVGQLAFYRWLTNPAPGSVTVAAGATVRLDTNFDSLTVAQNFLLHGIWDYTFTQPHAVMICALNPADDPVTVGPTLAVAARDVHVRGTFSACNKIYNSAAGTVISTTAGMQQFPIAGNGDAFVTGFDNAVASPTAESDGGNYGVLYKIGLATAGSDGNDLAFLITPRGGAWSGAVKAPVGLMPGGAVLLPTSGTFSDETMAVVAGEYHPGSGLTVGLEFMPTGGASFPRAAAGGAVHGGVAGAGDDWKFHGECGADGGIHGMTATDANTNKVLSFKFGERTGRGDGHEQWDTFQWRATVASAGTMAPVRMVVADSSTPALTNSRTFMISVNALGPVVVKPVAAGVGNSFQVQVSGAVGPDYILQGRASLTDGGGWVNLLTNTPGSLPFLFTDTNGVGGGSGFYRVVLAP